MAKAGYQKAYDRQALKSASGRKQPVNVWVSFAVNASTSASNASMDGLKREPLQLCAGERIESEHGPDRLFYTVTLAQISAGFYDVIGSCQ